MSDQIKHISDMMTALSKTIDDVQSGAVTESQARLIFKGRDLQLKTAALNIQFQRMEKGKKPMREMKLVEGEETGRPALFSGV